jgi:NAD+ synthase
MSEKKVPAAVDLSINSDLARQILAGFIRSELARVGLSKAVLGLSGGVDSALACVLAVEALGAKNVVAVRMPYRTSSQESLEHAQLVADKAGIDLLTVPITEMADGLISRFPGMDQTRRGNIMARCRMIVLYDLSAEQHGLVIGTGNKTEILLGYTTLFGDSACALNPLGDLYKTQVRQLSRDLSVPEVIVAKPPTADLFAGQTDEADLGYTYASVDQLLYLLVDERYSISDCVSAGYEPGFVERVVERIRRNQFKRMLPPIAKLSNRTVGYDFLYLRDWGT